jgi:hypothetical protein
MADDTPLIFQERRTRRFRSSDEVLAEVQKARNLAEQAKAAAGTWQQSVEEMIELFLSRHDVGLPDTHRYVGFDAKSSKAADIILRVVGMLTTDVRARYVAPLGSQRDRDRADRIEGHLNALDPWIHRRTMRRYDIQSLFWQLLVGRSYIQQTYLPFYWDKTAFDREPEESDREYLERVSAYRAKMGPPIMRESLDPRIIFPVMAPDGAVRAYIKIYRVARYHVVDALNRVGKNPVFEGDAVVDIQELTDIPGSVLPPTSDTPELTTPTEFAEFIDNEYVYYIVGNTLVHKYRHDGSIVICPAFGLPTGFNELQLQAVGILWSVRNEIPQLDFARTLWLQRAFLDVFPQLIVELDEDTPPTLDEEGQPKEWRIEPMTIKQIRGRITSAMRDTSSVDFRAFLGTLMEEIDLATIPPIARGVAGAQQAGYAINQLAQSMRTMWKPIIDSRELQLARLHEHYLHTIKHVIAQPVPIFAQVTDRRTGERRAKYFTIDPDDIHDHFFVEVEVKPELPIDKQGNMLTWWKLYQEGGASWEDYVRFGLDLCPQPSFRVFEP